MLTEVSDLEFQKVVNHHVGTGNWTQILWKIDQCPWVLICLFTLSSCTVKSPTLPVTSPSQWTVPSISILSIFYLHTFYFHKPILTNLSFQDASIRHFVPAIRKVINTDTKILKAQVGVLSHRKQGGFIHFNEKIESGLYWGCLAERYEVN